MAIASSRISIKDVAAAVGVSIGTVSRVINHKPNVDPECARKVREAIQSLGFTPNPMAANLPRKTESLGMRSSLSARGAIGFLSVNTSGELFARDDFNAGFLSGSEMVAGERGMDLLFAACGEQMQRCEIPRMVAKGLVDGVIVKSGGSLPSAWVESLAALTPVVLLSCRHDTPKGSISSVMNDNAGGIRKLMRHLFELGHRNVGFLSVRDLPLSPSFDHEQRHAAFLTSVTELGLSVSHLNVQLPTRDWSTQSLDEVVAGALDAWLALGARRPTAICCATDIYAITLMREARKRGLSIPADLSVTGFMDSTDAKLCEPPLTTAAVLSSEHGKAATSLLLDIIGASSGTSRHVLVDCPLMLRQSCDKPKDTHRRKTR